MPTSVPPSRRVPLVDVAVERRGQSHEVNLDGSAAHAATSAPTATALPAATARCLARGDPARAGFGFGLRGDRNLFPCECPYPAATPSLNEDFSTGAPPRSAQPLEGRLATSSSVAATGTASTATSTRRDDHPLPEAPRLPCATPATANETQGRYVADIDWTPTITRVGTP
jgi:hypothetical protein